MPAIMAIRTMKVWAIEQAVCAGLAYTSAAATGSRPQTETSVAVTVKTAAHEIAASTDARTQSDTTSSARIMMIVKAMQSQGECMGASSRSAMAMVVVHPEVTHATHAR